MNRSRSVRLPSEFDDAAWAALWREHAPEDSPVAGDWDALRTRLLEVGSNDRNADAAPIRLRRLRSRVRSPWLWSMAAGVLLAVGMGLFLHQGDLSLTAPVRAHANMSAMTDVEIAELRWSYMAAQAELGEVTIPAELQASVETLDASLRAVEVALRYQPDATFLRASLRRLHERRLQILRGLAFHEDVRLRPLA